MQEGRAAPLEFRLLSPYDAFHDIGPRSRPPAISRGVHLTGSLTPIQIDETATGRLRALRLPGLRGRTIRGAHGARAAKLLAIGARASENSPLNVTGVPP